MLFFLPSALFAQVSAYNYATGNVNGRTHVGGLTGRIAGKGGEVMNSYARGSVMGENHAGGLAGSNEGTIVSSYSSGVITGNTNIGGLAGSGTGTVTDSYWDIQSSGLAFSAGGTGRNTDPMTYPYASDTYTGWDFTSTWKADVPPFQNGGYPMLAASTVFLISVQVYPPGAGIISGEGYYLTGQEAQLQASATNEYVFKGWAVSSEILSTQPHFALKVTGNNHLVARFESKTTSVAADRPLSQTKMKIYPNPVKDVLWVDLSTLSGEVTTVSVINMTGQTVLQISPQPGNPSRISLTVSGLKPGIYLISARLGKGYASERFVKY